jgi:DNA-binding FadR family transcriptional regulator
MSSQVSLDLLPVRSEPAYRSIARLLRSKILIGEWVRGAKLPSEMILAEHLGVNRSTLREAIRSLEENGLLRRSGSKHLLVSAPQGPDIASRMTDAIVLQEITFFELWESMRCLEPILAEGAAARITDEELLALDLNIECTRHALSDQQQLTFLDIEFHNLIAHASRNRALQLCREPISQLFYPAFLQVFSRLNAGERLLIAHERILDGLHARDGVVSRTWMDKHIVDFRRGYERANLDMSKPVIWQERSPSAQTDNSTEPRQ